MSHCVNKYPDRRHSETLGFGASTRMTGVQARTHGSNLPQTMSRLTDWLHRRCSVSSMSVEQQQPLCPFPELGGGGGRDPSLCYYKAL